MKTIPLDPTDDFLLDNRYYPTERPGLHQRNREIRQRYWDHQASIRELAQIHGITMARVVQIYRGRGSPHYNK